MRPLFDAVENMLEAEQYRGCVFVNDSIEFPLSHEPAHLVAANSKAAFERMCGRSPSGPGPTTRPPWLRS